MIYRLGIDQGSSATKGCLVDTSGACVAKASVPVATQAIDAERFEQDPHELISSVQTVIQQLTTKATSDGATIASCGLTCQSSCVAVLDSHTALPCSTLLSHRDVRTRQKIDSLLAFHPLITQRSGIPVSAHFAASKMALLQGEFPRSTEVVTTLDLLLAHALDPSIVSTEDSMAARTLLYDLTTHAWDPELCEIFGVDRTRLSPISPSLSNHGAVFGIPLTARMRDQFAALSYFRALGYRGVLNLGTIGSICIDCNDMLRRIDGYISAVASSHLNSSRERVFRYAIEAVTAHCAKIFDFIQENLLPNDTLQSISPRCELAYASRKSPVSAFVSLGSINTPDWRHGLTDFIVGWDQSDQNQLLCAIVESLGCMLSANIRTLIDNGLLTPGVDTLALSGGPAQCDYLAQFICDATRISLDRLPHVEASALGIAIASGIDTLQEGSVSRTIAIEGRVKRFTPRRDRRQELHGWLELKSAALQAQVPSNAHLLRL